MANLICNDMWEWDGNNHLNYKMASEVQPDIILHSTNGVKFTSDMTKGEDVSDDIKLLFLLRVATVRSGSAWYCTFVREFAK